MELLFGFGALVLLAILALRFGADSRPGFHSAEHTLATQGYKPDRSQLPAPESTEAPLGSVIQEVTAPAMTADSDPAPAIDRRQAA
jgi:hypothetical protein